MALKRPQSAAKRKTTTVARGTGADQYTVKGHRATATQRRWIDGCLGQAADDGASRRVMIAVIMTITQESGAGEAANVTTGNDDTGGFQQGRNWISVEGARDPARATHAFLITGPTSWKKVHGGVKSAPGDLDRAITQVQISVGGYGQWESEATKTVDTWLANGGTSEANYYIKKYTFTRGEKGQSKENSWDASARLVEEVGAYRWAAFNTFFAVSGDELRAQAPSLTIIGDEGWLLARPAWSWASDRAIVEVTLQVLSDYWSVAVGGCVVISPRVSPLLAGRYMVWNVSGEDLGSPETTVVLRRPTRLKDEPANDVGERSTATGVGGKLQQICREISDHRTSYVYGGSHGTPLSKVKSSSHMDCSSSCSLALYRAGMFDGSVAITSGVFKSSWGRKGKGQEFTVMCNEEHVWIEGYGVDGKPAWRFDTSQHSGASGPMYTTVARSDQIRFTKKHWPGH